MARIITGDANAHAADGVSWVQDLCAELAVPPLSQFGVTIDDVPMVVPKAQRASSMQGNPIALTDDELAQILQQAI